MDNTNESQEFDLDDILREFHEDPDDDVKDTTSEEELDVDVLLVEEVSSPAPEQPEAPETAEAPEETPDPVSSGDTVRFDPEALSKEAEEAAPSDDTRAIDDLIAEALSGSGSDAPAPEAPQQPQTPPITFDPHQRLRELKKKLVAMMYRETL